ncbi:MAG TPA: 50S ribosomal protein L31 [Patescibacteria group bacterium]|jgi:large subunit ribosomal protein L31|nr:50S ribosomal protein L31 [Patescibacteria group bacterium]
MKDGIHPTYNADVAVTCSCGNKFTTGSTAQAIDTEICSNCHPFYTGKQKLLDTRGNVERFKKRQELAAKVAAEKKDKKPRKTRSATTTTKVVKK